MCVIRRIYKKTIAMKRNLLTMIFLSVFYTISYGQEPVYLTFSSTFLSQSIQAESITITNINRGGDTTLYWPDTVLAMIAVGIDDVPTHEQEFILFQNAPNPIGPSGSAGTSIKAYFPRSGTTQMQVTDLTGKTITSLNREVERGYSTFSFIPGSSNVYIVSAVFGGETRTIKVISSQRAGNSECSLKFMGTEYTDRAHKTTMSRSGFVYYTGDSLLMTAKYLQFTYNIIDTPIENTNYTFTFSEILSGNDQKTWKLLRDVSTGRYPLQVGPNDGSNVIWWAFGLNEELQVRTCMLNDEWIFTSDGQMLFRALGDYWAEGGIFHPDLINACQPVTQMYGPGGEDFSAWGDGDHIYAYTEEDITVTGYGAYIAFLKTGTNMEVTVPQEQITYELMKLSEGTTDTLIVQCNYMAGDNFPAYWRYVLVHYDNPDDEPPLPGPAPVANFTMTQQELTVFTTNTSINAEEYLWDFGDGVTSTEENPTHTYAVGGIYTISLTAFNTSGSDESVRLAFMSNEPITNALLIGEPWKVKVDNLTIFVGPEPGSFEWWSVPLEEMLPGGPWSCLVNDEFIFSTNGNYEYRTNGDARNDGYMLNYPVGCITDAELLNSGNGAAFRSATHLYTFYPGTGQAYPYIIFTNGSPSTAAFIAFYKGYYGGENVDPWSPPNGGNTTNRYEVLGYADDGVKEYLFISVDLNGDEPGGAAWSYILERNFTK